jgi:hypothetical protein
VSARFCVASSSSAGDVAGLYVAQGPGSMRRSRTQAASCARLALATVLRHYTNTAAPAVRAEPQASHRRWRWQSPPSWLALAAVGALGVGVTADGGSFRDAPEAARAVLALSRTLLAELSQARSPPSSGTDTRRRGWDGVSTTAATLLGDVAASPRRRHVLVSAGNGAVLEWHAPFFSFLDSTPQKWNSRSSSRLLNTASGGSAAAQEARQSIAALLSDENTGTGVVALQGSARQLLACASMDSAIADAGLALLQQMSGAQRGGMQPSGADVDAALDMVRAFEI